MTEEQKNNLKNKKGLPKIAWVVIGLFAFIIIVVSIGSDDMDKKQEEFPVTETEKIIEKEEETKEDLLLESGITEEGIALDEESKPQPVAEISDTRQGDKEEIKIEPKIDDEKIPAIDPDCIDINIASRERLMEITHIDDVRVDDLISKRTYSSVDQLTRVSGIGPARLNDIKEQGLACVR